MSQSGWLTEYDNLKAYPIQYVTSYHSLCTIDHGEYVFLFQTLCLFWAMCLEWQPSWFVMIFGSVTCDIKAYSNPSFFDYFYPFCHLSTEVFWLSIALHLSEKRLSKSHFFFNFMVIIFTSFFALLLHLLSPVIFLRKQLWLGLNGAVSLSRKRVLQSFSENLQALRSTPLPRKDWRGILCLGFLLFIDFIFFPELYE